jgi:hypothetical protein
MDGVARIAVICLLTMGWCAAVAETPLAVFPINEQSIAHMRQQHPLTSAEERSRLQTEAAISGFLAS